MRQWALSFGVAAGAVTVALWLWFGPWLWPGLPWVIAAGLPFFVGLLAPRIPVVFGVMPLLIPYLLEGNVQGRFLIGGIIVSLVASGLGAVCRRALFLGGVT